VCWVGRVSKGAQPSRLSLGTTPARRSHEQQQPRQLRYRELGQAPHDLVDLGLATEVEARVLGPERQEAPVGADHEWPCVVAVGGPCVEPQAGGREPAFGARAIVDAGQRGLERGRGDLGVAEQRAEQRGREPGQRGTRQGHAWGDHRSNAAAVQRRCDLDDRTTRVGDRGLSGDGQHHQAQVRRERRERGRERLGPHDRLASAVLMEAQTTARHAADEHEHRRPGSVAARAEGLVQTMARDPRQVVERMIEGAPLAVALRAGGEVHPGIARAPEGIQHGHGDGLAELGRGEHDPSAFRAGLRRLGNGRGAPDLATHDRRRVLGRRAQQLERQQQLLPCLGGDLDARDPAAGGLLPLPARSQQASERRVDLQGVVGRQRAVPRGRGMTGRDPQPQLLALALRRLLASEEHAPGDDLLADRGTAVVDVDPGAHDARPPPSRWALSR
jgi:hypothetical protein